MPLFRTITTGLQPGDAKAGFGVHWHENRVLSVLEARRAQGFLDSEALVGSIGDQWKIVGNSVARQPALALGVAVRKAWKESDNEAVDRASAGQLLEMEGSIEGETLTAESEQVFDDEK
jgi:DNA (cytosine-5)-methyltransferase 1